MATMLKLISDIELRLNGGNVSDDSSIDRRQIRFWLDTARNSLMDELIKDNKSSSISNFLSELPCLDIEKKEKECLNGCEEYNYIVKLPSLPIEVGNEDSGLYRVETQSGKIIKRIYAGEKERIKSYKFSKPSNSNIYYYRIGTELTILGGSYSFKEKGKVNVIMALNSTDSLAIDDEYPIHSSLVELVLETAESIGRRLLGMPQDEGNDGSHYINKK